MSSENRKMDQFFIVPAQNPDDELKIGLKFN